MTEAQQLAAVQQDPCAIKYISNPTLAVQLAAVQKTGWAIQYISEPAESVRMWAQLCEPSA